eukprot:IDg16715t1
MKLFVCSAMGGEFIAFSDLLDRASTLAAEIGTIYEKHIFVRLPTDSKSLFDVISKGLRTSEKQMMLFIAAARRNFLDKIIPDIGFVRSSANLSDGLKNFMSQAVIQSAVSSSMLVAKLEQWIIRK